MIGNFTFIVVTYNQEEIVLETLESIRWQIEQYGEGRKFQLIIADDGSKDNTTSVCDFWIKKYGELFYRIDKLYSKENRGTCKNYANAIRHIKGEAFREMAGDDLLPPNNIFSIYEENSDADIIAGIELPFCNRAVINDIKKYQVILLQSLYKVKDLRYSTQFACPLQNGTVWKLQLMSDSVLQYIEEFNLIEDRPQWYKIFQENKEIVYKFVPKPLLLYRRSSSSVTMLNSKTKELYDSDLNKILKNSYNSSRSVVTKFIIKIYFLMNRFYSLRIINPYLIWRYLKKCTNKRKIQKIYSDVMKKYLKSSNNHIKNIEKSAMNIRKEWKQNELL